MDKHQLNVQIFNEWWSHQNMNLNESSCLCACANVHRSLAEDASDVICCSFHFWTVKRVREWFRWKVRSEFSRSMLVGSFVWVSEQVEKKQSENVDDVYETKPNTDWIPSEIFANENIKMRWHKCIKLFSVKLVMMMIMDDDNEREKESLIQSLTQNAHSFDFIRNIANTIHKLDKFDMIFKCIYGIWWMIVSERCVWVCVCDCVF